MTITPWIAPAAILMLPPNFDTILQNTLVTEQNLIELLSESKIEDRAYFIVAWRTPEGHPNWECVNREELMDNYGIDQERTYKSFNFQFETI